MLKYTNLKKKILATITTFLLNKSVKLSMLGIQLNAVSPIT